MTVRVLALRNESRFCCFAFEALEKDFVGTQTSSG
eukprot:COSAG06_NODE_32822_length_499_cov_2.562500_1_plen_34_part_01